MRELLPVISVKWRRRWIVRIAVCGRNIFFVILRNQLIVLLVYHNFITPVSSCTIICLENYTRKNDKIESISVPFVGSFCIRIMAEVEGKKLTELRVIDLKTELERRGLDKTGNKAALLERLSKVNFLTSHTAY